MKKFLWLTGPAVWFILLAALLITWAVMDPNTAIPFFDNNGTSPFELATLPIFALIAAAVWVFNPFEGSKCRQRILQVLVTMVALLAIAKELDLHLVALHYLYPDFVTDTGVMAPGLFKPNGAPLGGTPYKMRVLTNGGVPLGMKFFIVTYFVAFFGAFAGGFIYLLPTWVKGVFKLDPCAWAFGTFGASGVVVQISDRLPAWLGHGYGLVKAEDGGVTMMQSLVTILEEGGEMMLAVAGVVTVVLGWATKQHD